MDASINSNHSVHYNPYRDSQDYGTISYTVSRIDLPKNMIGDETQSPHCNICASSISPSTPCISFS